MEKIEILKNVIVVNIQKLPNEHIEYLYKLTENSFRYEYHSYYLSKNDFSKFLKAYGVKDNMVLLTNW